MSNPNTESFEDQLARISGDIDQVTVQKVFKKLATGNKKHDDALWALTSEASREIRQLVKGEILAAHQATIDQRVAEARKQDYWKRHCVTCGLRNDWAPTNIQIDFADYEGWCQCE